MQLVTRSRWLVLSLQRREQNNESKTTVAMKVPKKNSAIDVCWQPGRLDDRQGGDAISSNVTMERVRETITFNTELEEESTWLLLTSEQMGLPLRQTGGGEHEERAEDLDSSQKT